MYSTPITITTSSKDMLGTIDSLSALSQPTIGDLLYAGQRQRSRILDRTSRGVDFEEKAFHPYSTTGPYYFYPSKGAKNRASGRATFARKIGVGKTGITKVKGGGTAERTRLGIKFSSYAAFKAALGRGVVDLFGPWAPHMLQAMIVKVNGVLASDGAGESSNSTPGTEIVIGIYGSEAERASGHNQGTGHLPQRKFLAASEVDKDAVLNDIFARIMARVKNALVKL